MSKTQTIFKQMKEQDERWKRYLSTVAEKFIKFCRNIFIKMQKIRIARNAFDELRRKLSSSPPERGGILLGPVNSNAITHFYFDQTGRCTGNSYNPDYITINRKLQQQWRPAGLEIKGIAHSHGGHLDRLTYGDMSYIKRLLNKNPEMNMFIAPIVLPYRNSIHPMVISRDRMDYIQQGYFELF